jgi:hypothetical protein
MAAAAPPAEAALGASCADYATQAEAQRAADTRDGDGDGVYCEALPCPCAGPSAPAERPAPSTAPLREGDDPPDCRTTE